MARKLVLCVSLHLVNMKHFILVFLSYFGLGGCDSQAGLELMIFQSQLPKCWDYSMWGDPALKIISEPQVSDVCVCVHTCTQRADNSNKCMVHPFWFFLPVFLSYCRSRFYYPTPTPGSVFPHPSYLSVISEMPVASVQSSMCLVGY